MSRTDQVLIIEPANELTFSGPFTTSVSSIMTLTNPSDKKVCFKIKTTAPKRYCVKPNSGVIDPTEKVSVTVTLQPFEFDPTEKNRHKFMVQSIYAPDGVFNQDLVWKETEGCLLMDSKLKCVFLMPDENNGNEYSTAVTEQARPIFPTTTAASDGDATNSKIITAEVAKLTDELTSLKKENLQIKEEILRHQRQAVVGSSPSDHRDSAKQSQPFNVGVVSPDQTALSTIYLYAAFALLVIGIIIGKWIF